MVKQKEALKYYLDIYKSKPIYVWGMNAPTIITQKTIAAACKSFKSATYTQKYYDDKLIEGLNHIGSDCSGLHYGISGYDTTAQGYYDRCTKKGDLKSMPTDEIVLLFASSKGSTKAIDHTGVYLPGYGAFHMKSSKDNGVLEDVKKRGWIAWGYADFIDYTAKPEKNPIVLDMQRELNTLKTVDPKLEIDGIAGKKTLHAILSEGNLKFGSKHFLVKYLKQYLNSVGAGLPVNNVFDIRTNIFLRNWQRANGLPADGVCDADTWALICEKLRG